MKSDIPEGARAPTLTEALISLVSLIVGISTSILIYGLDAHIPMLLGIVVASIVALRCGFSWTNVQNGMMRGIAASLPAIMILLIVGILIGVWILSGVVPTLVYYGLQILSPSIFLPATVLVCSVVSLATGTSWGTTGTVGVAFMGIGAGLGIPLPLVAGAVLSGAYFGDKMSPLSDTTNLAPAMAGTDLFTHIKHMSYTTSVSIALTLVIETALSHEICGRGWRYVDRVNTILTTLDQAYNINPVLLLAPVIVMVVSYKKVPAIPGITIGAFAGGLFAFGLQGSNWPDILTAAMYGVTSETGVADVDSLLYPRRHELHDLHNSAWRSLRLVSAVSWSARASCGRLQMRCCVRSNPTAALITTTALTGVMSNLVLCDQYMSIVMTGRTYVEEYKNRGLTPENLSRAVEDSATVTANLVPWNSGGAYQAATLGVATLAYLPFAFFCWLSPIVTILFGVMGWTIKPLQEDEAGKAEAAAT